MTTLTEWQRRVALDAAQAFPLVPATAKPACTYPDCDCEWPGVGCRQPEAARIACDLAHHADKASGALRRREDQRAVEAQLQATDLGWL